MDGLGAQTGEPRRHVALETLEDALHELSALGVPDMPAESREVSGTLQVPRQRMVRGGMKEAPERPVEARRKGPGVAKEAGIAWCAIHRHPRNEAHHSGTQGRITPARAKRPPGPVEGAHHPGCGQLGVGDRDVRERRVLELQELVGLGRVGDLEQVLAIGAGDSEVRVPLAPERGGPAANPELSFRDPLRLRLREIGPGRF